MGTNDELRVGVIGAGGRGGLSHYAHKPGEGSRLIAACDIRPEPLQHFQERFGDDTFVCADYRELLERADVDAVFVTTPDNFHEEHALAALDAGKHVYLEKPMTITIEGCDRVLHKARETGLKLYLGHNMRHMAFVKQMKQLIDDGAIGEVKAGWCRHFVAYGGDAYYKDWHSERANTTGLLLQKGAHDIDVLHYLCRGYGCRVHGMGALTVYDKVQDHRPADDRGNAAFVDSNWPPLAQTQLSPVIDVEDISMLTMQLDNGVFCTYEQCHYTPDAWRNYTIIGTEGRIENLGEERVALWNTRCGYKPEGDKVFEAPHSAGGHGGCDPAIVAEFVRYVREGGKIHTSPVAARNSVAVGCLATHSLRNGGVPVEVPPLPQDLIDYFNTDLAD